MFFTDQHIRLANQPLKQLCGLQPFPIAGIQHLPQARVIKLARANPIGQRCCSQQR